MGATTNSKKQFLIYHFQLKNVKKKVQIREAGANFETRCTIYTFGRTDIARSTPVQDIDQLKKKNFKLPIIVLAR